jgi:anti-anti-sigma factor
MIEPPFTTRAEVLGDSVVVHVDGDLDVATSGQLGNDIAPLVENGPNLVLDLAAVEFMDSAGIGAVLAARAAALEHGGAFEVRNPSSSVRLLLDVTGLAALLMHEP